MLKRTIRFNRFSALFDQTSQLLILFTHTTEAILFDELQACTTAFNLCWGPVHKKAFVHFSLSRLCGIIFL